MSITSDLEKLTALRDRGDLSQAEFEEAKALRLSEEESTSPRKEHPDAPGKREKQRKTRFLIGVLATLAAALSAASAMIAPSPSTLGVLIFWIGLSISGWLSHAKLKNGKERSE